MMPVSRPKGRPRADLVILQDALDEDPHQRDWNEYFPAEPHDLVVAITRERRAKPQEAEQEEPDLQQQPDEAGCGKPGECRRQRPPFQWRQPATKEEHCS